MNDYISIDGLSQEWKKLNSKKFSSPNISVNIWIANYFSNSVYELLTPEYVTVENCQWKLIWYLKTKLCYYCYDCGCGYSFIVAINLTVWHGMAYIWDETWDEWSSPSGALSTTIAVHCMKSRATERRQKRQQQPFSCVNVIQFRIHLLLDWWKSFHCTHTHTHIAVRQNIRMHAYTRSHTV